MKYRGWIPAVAILGIAIWWAFRPARTDAPATMDDPVETPREAVSKPMSRAPAADPSETSAATAIRNAQLALEADPDDSGRVLADLKRALRSGDEAEAAAAIARFLRTGGDTATHEAFTVGPGGALLGAPSLRTALMDWLPTLDPQRALEVARETLRQTDSAEEYALALRNLAWNDLDGDLLPELAAAWNAMLEREDWRRNPGNGFLESFDIAVKLADPATFSRLADLVVPGREAPDLLRAACMSMDRMILRDPTLLDAAWRDSPHWMEQAPMQRASLMSRLDLRRESHREVLEEYLASAEVGPQEADAFIGLFPNGNHLYGHRLVTADEESPSIEERAALDRKFLSTLDEMLRQNRARPNDRLQRVRDRLAGVVGGSGG